jgi:hypothetical protein
MEGRGGEAISVSAEFPLSPKTPVFPKAYQALMTEPFLLRHRALWPSSLLPTWPHRRHGILLWGCLPHVASAWEGAFTRGLPEVPLAAASPAR